MAVASFVLGLFSILFSAMGPFALILGVLGIIFGSLRRGTQNRGALAIAGLILSIIGTVFSAIMTILYFIAIGVIGSSVSI